MGGGERGGQGSVKGEVLQHDMWWPLFSTCRVWVGEAGA